MNKYIFYFDMPNGKRYWFCALNIDVVKKIPGATNIEPQEKGKRYDGIGYIHDEYSITKNEDGSYTATERELVITSLEVKRSQIPTDGPDLIVVAYLSQAKSEETIFVTFPITEELKDDIEALAKIALEEAKSFLLEKEEK